MRVALRLTGLVASLALMPALGQAQSSNSSTNCSNGNCTRLESYIPDDRRDGPGWTRFDAWREGRAWQDPRARRDDDRRTRDRRDRRDRDDDDDDD
ncbi:hypothetical protein ACQW02_23695 [Humitalea sp. 24SJ18S-53]|uniref:hypothetical protein n=1 Tax=Humitalea sp. 24SJ18S-53 TaxID=3422307 RepID=UPI003D67FC54